jgi:hypothetical protein
MTDVNFDDLFEGEPLGGTPAAFDLSELSISQAMLALQLAMARDGGTRSQTLHDVPLGGDLYTVTCGVGFSEFIQERHDMGPQYALHEVSTGGRHASFKLVGDVVFKALVDGGMAPETARRLRVRWVDNRPMSESLPLAQLFLSICVNGVKDEPPGKGEGEGQTPTPSPTSPEGRSDSPPSTDTPPSQD